MKRPSFHANEGAWRLISVCSLIGALAAGTLLGRPPWHRARANLATLRAVMAGQHPAVEGFPPLAAGAAAETDVDAVPASGQSTFSEALILLQRYAEETGVEILRLRRLPARDQTDHAEWPLRLHLAGSFHSVLAFVLHIEAAPPPMAVRRLSLERAHEEATRLSVEMDLVLLLSPASMDAF